ncbi:MAG: AlpA family phage regulatory protein [bacterium]|nr:AlpA family phage regulatory protein [bacterium]
MNQTLPETGYVRLSQFIPSIIPVSKSTWWAGVKEGRFPQPIKLGPRTTAWRVVDIRAFLERGLNWKQEKSP